MTDPDKPTDEEEAERKRKEEFRNIMPEPEGRAAYEAYERWIYGE